MSDEQENVTTELDVIEDEATDNQEAVVGDDDASRLPRWVLPVAVGAGGLILAVATGIGGFVAGTEMSDRVDGDGPRGGDRWMSQEHAPGQGEDHGYAERGQGERGKGEHGKGERGKGERGKGGGGNGGHGSEGLSEQY